MTQPNLRVVSFNIHKGVHHLFRHGVIAELKAFLGRQNADLVFLQEIRGANFSSRDVANQLEHLADSLWTHFAYGKNAMYSSGHHGNAIMSKYPIEFFENIELSNHRLERRGLLHVRIQLSLTQPLHLFCLHMDLTEWGRRRQLQKVIEQIRLRVPQDFPMILAGDFNDWRVKVNSVLLNELNLTEVFQQKNGTSAKTFPAFWPQLSLDRIFVRGMEVAQVTTLDSRLSDHLALLAELKVAQQITK